MNSSQFRSCARENLSGRWGKAALLTFVYMLFVWLISVVASLLSIIGSIATIVINPVIAYGFIKELILFRNGYNVEVLDFFKLGFKDFGKVWKVTFALIPKYIGPIILMILAMLGMTAGTIFTIVADNTTMNEGIQLVSSYGGAIMPDMHPGLSIRSSTASVVMGIVTMVSMIMLFASIIWMIPIAYKYYFANYELVYNPNMPAKEIVNKAGFHMKGKRWKLFVLMLTFLGWILLATIAFGIPFFWISPYMVIAQIFFYEWASNRFNPETVRVNIAPNGYNPQQQPNQYDGYNPQQQPNQYGGYNPQQQPNQYGGYNQQSQNNNGNEQQY